MSRLVGQKQIHPGQAIVEDELGLEVERLLLEHGQGAVDGAVELGFRCGEPERIDVVP